MTQEAKHTANDIPFDEYGIPESTALRLAMSFAMDAATHATRIGHKAEQFAACLRVALEYYETAESEGFVRMEARGEG